MERPLFIIVDISPRGINGLETNGRIMVSEDDDGISMIAIILYGYRRRLGQVPVAGWTGCFKER